LVNIIVCAGFEAAHAVLLLTARGQHDDRHIGCVAVGAAQAAADLDPRTGFSTIQSSSTMSGTRSCAIMQRFLAIRRYGRHRKPSLA
jgi:hypothetical protein